MRFVSSSFHVPCDPFLAYELWSWTWRLKSKINQSIYICTSTHSGWKLSSESFGSSPLDSGCCPWLNSVTDHLKIDRRGVRTGYIGLFWVLMRTHSSHFHSVSDGWRLMFKNTELLIVSSSYIQNNYRPVRRDNDDYIIAAWIKDV